MKVALCCRLGTVNAGAELGDVQIHFQNPPLGPGSLDEQREVRLESLAKITAPRPEEKVLGDLLADGAGAAHAMTMLIQLVGFLDGFHVETPVLGKLLILR